MSDNKRIKIVVHWLIAQGVANNQEDLGRKIGVLNKSYVSQLVNGRINNIDFINKLVSLDERLNINWLLSGTGDMLKIPTATADNNSVAVAGDHNTVSHGVEQKELELLRSENKHLQELLSAKDQIIHLLEKSQK